ncbi:TonB-dependent receptor, partial [Salmonella enterica subsp. enterica serovar Typhimurium]|nr:TonB-dependent receptor [Salmonella enterica subsp. enterica serovar Typhimurium]
RWQLADEFLLRSTYAEGFRAPSLGELFGQATRFDADITDPCLISVNGDPPTAPRANCGALGVPAGARQFDPQIGVETGGNRNLEP